MSNAGNSKRPGSATTSKVKSRANGSANDFLAQQAEEAKTAANEKLSEMRGTLRGMADLKAWTREYPWTSLGVATALGFLAGAVAARPKPSDDADRLAAMLEEALSDERRDRARKAAVKRSKLRTILSYMAGALFSAMQASLVAAFTAPVQRPVTPPSDDDSEDASPCSPDAAS